MEKKDREILSKTMKILKNARDSSANKKPIIINGRELVEYFDICNVMANGIAFSKDQELTNAYCEKLLNKKMFIALGIFLDKLDVNCLVSEIIFEKITKSIDDLLNEKNFLRHNNGFIEAALLLRGVQTRILTYTKYIEKNKLNVENEMEVDLYKEVEKAKKIEEKNLEQISLLLEKINKIDYKNSVIRNIMDIFLIKEDYYKRNYGFMSESKGLEKDIALFLLTRYVNAKNYKVIGITKVRELGEAPRSLFVPESLDGNLRSLFKLFKNDLNAFSNNDYIKLLGNLWKRETVSYFQEKKINFIKSKYIDDLNFNYQIFNKNWINENSFFKISNEEIRSINLLINEKTDVMKDDNIIKIGDLEVTFKRGVFLEDIEVKNTSNKKLTSNQRNVYQNKLDDVMFSFMNIVVSKNTDKEELKKVIKRFNILDDEFKKLDCNDMILRKKII